MAATATKPTIRQSMASNPVWLGKLQQQRFLSDRIEARDREIAGLRDQVEPNPQYFEAMSYATGKPIKDLMPVSPRAEVAKLEAENRGDAMALHLIGDELRLMCDELTHEEVETMRPRRIAAVACIYHGLVSIRRGLSELIAMQNHVSDVGGTPGTVDWGRVVDPTIFERDAAMWRDHAAIKLGADITKVKVG